VNIALDRGGQSLRSNRKTGLEGITAEPWKPGWGRIVPCRAVGMRFSESSEETQTPKSRWGDHVIERGNFLTGHGSGVGGPETGNETIKKSTLSPPNNPHPHPTPPPTPNNTPTQCPNVFVRGEFKKSITEAGVPRER